MFVILLVVWISPSSVFFVGCRESNNIRNITLLLPLLYDTMAASTPWGWDISIFTYSQSVSTILRDTHDARQTVVMGEEGSRMLRS